MEIPIFPEALRGQKWRSPPRVQDLVHVREFDNLNRDVFFGCYGLYTPLGSHSSYRVWFQRSRAQGFTDGESRAVVCADCKAIIECKDAAWRVSRDDKIHGTYQCDSCAKPALKNTDFCPVFVSNGAVFSGCMFCGVPEREHRSVALPPLPAFEFEIPPLERVLEGGGVELKRSAQEVDSVPDMLRRSKKKGSKERAGRSELEKLKAQYGAWKDPEETRIRQARRLRMAKY